MIQEPFLELENVHSCGFGYKDSKNKIQDTIDRLRGNKCIKVFVSKKLPESELKGKDIVPKYYNGIKTDVEEVPEIIPLRGMERPLIGGCSAMLKGWTACTQGGIVFENGEIPSTLSNEHCYDRWFDTEQVGEKILQPSPLDGGRDEHEISYLKNANHRMVLDGKTLNEFDTSVQPLKKGVPYKALYQKEIGKVSEEIATVDVGYKVQKRGRTTGYTKSNIIAADVLASVRYGVAGQRIGMFKGQYFARNRNWDFVNGGDSGSLVYDMQKRCVGNLFAGSPGENGVGVISPIGPIMEKLNFTFEPVEKDDEIYVAAVGERWYVKAPLGETNTLVRLNVRTAPIVEEGTYVKTLPVGARIELLNYIGVHGRWHWYEIKIK